MRYSCSHQRTPLINRDNTSSPLALGKHRPKRSGVDCKDQRLRVEKMANIRHGFERGCLLTIYVQHNNEIERSLLGT